MSFLSDAVIVFQTIYAGFFGWMPFSMQIWFGVVLSVAVFMMVLRIIGTVLQALPFL